MKTPTVKEMKEKLEFMDMYDELSYILTLESELKRLRTKITKSAQAKCTIPVVSGSLLADFLKYAIDETTRISGDYGGNAGTLYVDDTYEKIAEDYISICNDR